MRGWWGRPLCSRNARSQKRERERSDHPSCSQNAHDETVLVRCAQWKATPPPPQGSPNPLGRVWKRGTVGQPEALAGERTRLGASRVGG